MFLINIYLMYQSYQKHTHQIMTKSSTNLATQQVDSGPCSSMFWSKSCYVPERDGSQWVSHVLEPSRGEMLRERPADHMFPECGAQSMFWEPRGSIFQEFIRNRAHVMESDGNLDSFRIFLNFQGTRCCGRRR